MSQYFNFIDTAIPDKKFSEGQFPFSKYLFWDRPIEMIDTKQHKQYIIERVLAIRFLSEFYLLLKIYSTDEMKAAVKKK